MLSSCPLTIIWFPGFSCSWYFAARSLILPETEPRSVFSTEAYTSYTNSVLVLLMMTGAARRCRLVWLALICGLAAPSFNTLGAWRIHAIHMVLLCVVRAMRRDG